MTAQHRGDSSGSGRPTTRRRWRVPALLASVALASTAILFGSAPSAVAADTSATISLTGITSNTYPVGGNTVWVQPGSSLTITEAPISAGANQGLLGAVSGLVNGALGALFKVVDLQAVVDLSSVQRGTVVLGGGGQGSVATPGLGKGVYPIAWSFKAVVANTLTGARQTVALNGNQLNSLGIKLNASNQYVGYIVSDTQSPCGGAQCIALQTPTLSVAPSLPVVGQLPTVTVPGQNVNVPVPSIPGVNTSGSGSSTPSTGATTTAPAGGSTTTSPTNPYSYTAPGCTGPCAVVPKGGGGGGQVGGAYGVTLGDLGDAAAGSASSSGTGTASGSAAGDALAADGRTAGDQVAVDRAFAANGGATSLGANLPTGLTIAAIVALAVTTGLWFLRRRSARA